MSTLVSTPRAAHRPPLLDAVPAWAWLALQAAALWTHWRWAAARVADGSDDPLGVVGLAVLAWAVWRTAPGLRGEPRPGWLAAAPALTVGSTAAGFAAPRPAGALLGACARGPA